MLLGRKDDPVDIPLCIELVHICEDALQQL